MSAVRAEAVISRALIEESAFSPRIPEADSRLSAQKRSVDSSQLLGAKVTNYPTQAGQEQQKQDVESAEN